MQQRLADISHAKRTSIFATLVSACVVLSLLSTALNTALPALIVDLDVSVAVGQWATSGYALALAVATPLTAFLATRFPTRKLYLVSLGCFIAGSVTSACAPTFILLMVGRIIQACANALIANVTQVSVMSLYPAGGRGRAMGWLGLATGAAPIAAPALGGIVVDLVGWRWLFGGIAIISALSFVSALFVMDDLLDSAPKPFDPISFLLSVLAFGGFAVGLGNMASLGIASPMVLAPLVLGLVTGVFFVRRQQGSSDPFLKVQLLLTPAFARATVSSAALYLVMMGASAVLPLYIQGNLGEGAFISGLVVLPGAVCTAVASPFAGNIFDKLGIRALLLSGGALMALSCVLMCVPAVETSLPLLGALNALRCVAVGMLTMPLMTWGNASVPAPDMPHASALLTSLRNLAGALGVAVFVGIFATFGFVAACAALAVASMLIVACGLSQRTDSE